jgi:enhancing lycopene biosynthesis protein 2
MYIYSVDCKSTRVAHVHEVEALGGKRNVLIRNIRMHRGFVENHVKKQMEDGDVVLGEMEFSSVCEVPLLEISGRMYQDHVVNKASTAGDISSWK